jgi:hypothetical protein
MPKKQKNIDLESQRYGMFMNQDSFDLEIMYGRHFLETDNIQMVNVYRINLIESKSHSLYGQSKSSDKKYMAPVKIKTMLNIAPSSQEFYGGNQGGITRDDSGILTFGVYLKELEENQIEISRGDIIGYNLNGGRERYYEVENANTVTDTTDKTIGGFASYWKKVISVPVKEDVTLFLSETNK